MATSGATFFRSIGGSFGTAIFGAIFSNVLVGNLARHLHGTALPSGFSARTSPRRCSSSCRPPCTRAFRWLRRVHPDGLHRRRADRLARLPAHLADPPGRAEAVARPGTPRSRLRPRPRRRRAAAGGACWLGPRCQPRCWTGRTPPPPSPDHTEVFTNSVSLTWGSTKCGGHIMIPGPGTGLSRNGCPAPLTSSS